MLLTSKSIKSQIKYQVPWFYNQSYPLFVKFLEYYYQWMETLDKDKSYGVLSIIDNFKKIKDIDSTLDELIPLFKTLYFKSLPEETKAERRVFIKRIVDLYRVKGTKESLDLLFKIILGETPELYYPKKFLARSSNVPFVSIFFVYLNPSFLPSEFDYYTLKGDKITFEGFSSFEIIISEIFKVSSIFQLVLDISKEEKDLLKGKNKIYYKGVQIGTLFPVLSSFTVISSLYPQRKDKIFSFSDVSSISPAICSFEFISKGKIDSFDILSGGEGYLEGDIFVCSETELEFEAKVTQVNNFGEIVDISIIKNNFFTDVIPPIISLSKTGTGSSISWYSSSHKIIKKVKILDSGIGIDASSATCSVSGLVFSYETTFIGKRSEFAESVNLLGGKKILQDNFLHQNFSYVIAYKSSQKDFPETEIRQLIHSPGFILFTRKDIESVASSEIVSNIEQSVAPYTTTVSLEIEDISQIRRNLPKIKYTNDTPLFFVRNYKTSEVDSLFCFETKAEISQKDFNIVTPSTIDDINSSLENTINSLILF